jgi:hypothetical protein
MKTNVTLAILALTAAILHADVLLDDEGTIERKLGAPIKTNGWTREYQKDHYIHKIELASDRYLGGAYEGMCIIQEIRRADNKPLFEHEVHALLPTLRGIWRAAGNGEYKADHGRARWKSGSKYLVITLL